MRIVDQYSFGLTLLVHSDTGVSECSNFGSYLAQLFIQDVSFGVDLQVDLPLDDIWIKPVSVRWELPINLNKVQLPFNTPVYSLDVIGEHLPTSEARLGVQSKCTRGKFNNVYA